MFANFGVLDVTNGNETMATLLYARRTKPYMGHFFFKPIPVYTEATLRQVQPSFAERRIDDFGEIRCEMSRAASSVRRKSTLAGHLLMARFRVIFVEFKSFERRSLTRTTNISG